MSTVALATLLKAVEAAQRLGAHEGQMFGVVLQRDSAPCEVSLTPLEARVFHAIQNAIAGRFGRCRIDGKLLSVVNAVSLVAGLTELFKALDEDEASE